MSRLPWHDLLDELHLTVFPSIAGAGTPLFEGRPPGALKRIQTPSRVGSGNMLVCDEVSRRKSLVGNICICQPFVFHVQNTNFHPLLEKKLSCLKLLAGEPTSLPDTGVQCNSVRSYRGFAFHPSRRETAFALSLNASPTSLIRSRVIRLVGPGMLNAATIFPS